MQPAQPEASAGLQCAIAIQKAIEFAVRLPVRRLLYARFEDTIFTYIYIEYVELYRHDIEVFLVWNI